MRISLVIPVYNEAESIEELHRQIADVAERAGYDVEMVLVSDGSTDSSWEVIESLARTDRRVHGVRLRRNFGKAAALAAGFDAAQGDVVVTMDADLQDDPAELPKMLARLDEGWDVVSGWKLVRHDPWHKRWPSKLFNWLVGRLTGVRLHDHNCGYKCYRRDVILEVRLYGELHRFVPVLAAARGFRVGEVVVNHRPRQHGRSKYGLSRIVKGFLDLVTVKFLTGYGHRPQHALGTVGLASLVLGAAVLVYLAIGWGISRLNGNPADDFHLHQRAALYYGLGLLLLGGQFFSMGLLAEMITAFLGREADTYSIAEVTSHRRVSVVGEPAGGHRIPAAPHISTSTPDASQAPHSR
jgi:dolichol-phosphate mannosyltransferase